MDRETFWSEFAAGNVAVRIENADELDVFNEALEQSGLPATSKDTNYVRYPWRVAYSSVVVGWTGEGAIADKIVAYFTFAEWSDVVGEANTPTEVDCPDLLTVL